MKHEKPILCTILMLNAVMLVLGAIWVNSDAYHRHRDVWEISDPWPYGQTKALIDFYPPGLFDYSCGVFFILCAALSSFAYFTPRKIANGRSDLSKAISHDICLRILRAFVGMGATLLIIQYVVEQIDHLEFISLIQIDGNEGPLYFIKMDTVLLSSLSCGIVSLVWLMATLLRNRFIRYPYSHLPPHR